MLRCRGLSAPTSAGRGSRPSQHRQLAAERLIGQFALVEQHQRFDAGTACGAQIAIDDEKVRLRQRREDHQQQR